MNSVRTSYISCGTRLFANFKVLCQAASTPSYRIHRAPRHITEGSVQSSHSARNLYLSGREVELPKVPFGDFLWSRIDKWPNATALVNVVTGQEWSYKEVRQQCTDFGVSLRNDLGLKSDDVIAVFLPNIPEFVVVTVGAMEAGIIPTLINPAYTPDEIAYQLSDSGASTVVTTPQLIPRVQQALNIAGLKNGRIIVADDADQEVPKGVLLMKDLLAKRDPSSLKSIRRKPEDLAILPYSSGTTGRPKGVMITHRNLTANLVCIDEMKYHKNRTDKFAEVIPLVLPVFHIYGLAVASINLLTGSKGIMVPKFEEQTFLKSLKEATLLYFVPPLIQYLAANPKVTPDLLKSTRIIINGAAPVTPTDAQNVSKKAPNLKFKQGYGLTETSTMLCLAMLNEDNTSTVGPPGVNTKLKVVDSISGNDLGPNETGEVVVQGPQVMKGYWKNKEATDDVIKNDWFYTGDLGYYDSKGFVYITGRLKELIKVKGFQVAPAELEGVLQSHPDVADTAVVGVTDPRKGEKPVAFIILEKGAKANPKALTEFMADKLAEFKIVEDFIFVDNIPKSAAGKILRKELKKQLKTE